MSERVTLTHVARKAGVSLSTASLAFSGAGPIAEGTRRRVLEAAESLGYSGPNPVARSLRRGRSGIIGVVVGSDLRARFRDPVALQTLDGLATTLAAEGLGVLLLPSGPAAGGLLAHSALDAAVLLVLRAPGAVGTLRRRGIPMVRVDSTARGTSSVLVDDEAGMAALAAHLRELGHERVAVLTLGWGTTRRQGPLDLATAPPAKVPYTAARMKGILGAGIDPVAVQETTGSLVEEGIRAGHAVLDASPRPTAVVAMSDLLAAGVVLAARERGLQVPEDVSVAGFDGASLPWLSEHELTSVCQPIEEKGQRAAQAAIRLAAGEKVGSVTLGCTLRVGTTTGPAPA
ncbi:MAG TPA: LacI family DNA-binding transcriptional regulator [Ruania sp.]|nr:LacI family DNA-binding transcriptional regulator [Ruania sp.]